MSGSLPLDALQAWLQGTILDGGSDGDVPGAAEHLLATSRASAEVQARIYRDLYRTRMRDVLAEDYPATRRLVGEERFEEACRAFLRDHPSEARTLTRYGAGFARLLEERARVAAELARLEWTLREVFHAPRDPVLTADALRSIPQERFGEVSFEPVRALVLLRFDHDVVALRGALRRGDATPPIVARPTCVAVHRAGTKARPFALRADAFALLEALVAGAPLDDALGCLVATGVDPDTVAARVEGWFREFTVLGLFSAVRLADRGS